MDLRQNKTEEVWREVTLGDLQARVRNPCLGSRLFYITVALLVSTPTLLLAQFTQISHL